MGDEKSCRIRVCVLRIRGSQTMIDLQSKNGPKTVQNGQKLILASTV